MVKITHNLIQRSLKNRSQGGDKEKALKKLTHLNLQEKEIEKIENLDLCPNLMVLYLFHNKINRIENLDYLTRITSLYLQGNMIEKIENLGALVNLNCLRLAKNRITVVEGLENLYKLEQLWLEYQDLPEGKFLRFERSSLLAISGNLKLLNVASNGLKDLLDLTCLKVLERLYAENNNLEELQTMVNCVVHWPYLIEMNLKGNPVTRQRKYRDNMIVHSPAVQILDETIVPAMFRNSLLRWKQLTSVKQSSSETNKGPFLEAGNILSGRPLEGIQSNPDLSKTKKEAEREEDYEEEEEEQYEEDYEEEDEEEEKKTQKDEEISSISQTLSSINVED